MNRRNFVVRSFSGVGALFVMASTTSCWFTGTVFTQIMAYVGVGLTAFQAIVSLLDPAAAAGVAGIITLVKAGFADLQLAVQDYNNAPAADKATLLGKVKVILTDLQAHLQSFWSDLNLPGGSLATLISGLLGIILSTLAGFAVALPGAAVPARALPARFVPVTPQKRDKKEFERDFNKALTDAGKPPVKFSS